MSSLRLPTTAFNYLVTVAVSIMWEVGDKTWKLNKLNRKWAELCFSLHRTTLRIIPTMDPPSLTLSRRRLIQSCPRFTINCATCKYWTGKPRPLARQTAQSALHDVTSTVAWGKENSVDIRKSQWQYRQLIMHMIQTRKTLVISFDYCNSIIIIECN